MRRIPSWLLFLTALVTVTRAPWIAGVILLVIAFWPGKSCCHHH